MDKLQSYWSILNQFGIVEPCRMYLSGPFEADEVALRFLLHKLGFTLLDRWNTGAAQWVIHGKGSTVQKTGAPIRTGERQIAPALLQLPSPFHLLPENADALQRRRNLFKFLMNRDGRNVQLGLTLIENGGLTSPFLEQVLAAWYLQQKDRGKQLLFLRHVGAWLPDQLLDLLRESLESLPFRLGFVRNKLPFFSPGGFLKQAANIRILSLSGFRNLDLEGIEVFRNLSSLTLNNNQLSALPAEIGKLRTLRHLSLFEPQLQSLPGSFYNLPLEKIWMGSNRLPENMRVSLRSAFHPEVFRNARRV